MSTDDSPWGGEPVEDQQLAPPETAAGAAAAPVVVTVVGEALVDLVRTAMGEVTAHPGGSPANVAVGLARLGTPVALVTRFGDDEHGSLVRQHLVGNGVQLLLGSEDPSSSDTSVAEATLDATGAATYDFRIEWDLGDSPPAPAAGSLALHTGSIAATLAPGAAVVRAMMQEARGRLTVTYDPNARPSLMGDVDVVRATMEELVGLSDVVKVSDEDLAWLYPGEDPTAVAQRWLDSGPALVVVTRGADGAQGLVRAGAHTLPRRQVDVVDTVGAGDAFMAGLLDALHRRGLLGAPAATSLRDLGTDVLADVLEKAALVAALTVGRPGADPPTAAEVAAAG